MKKYYKLAIAAVLALVTTMAVNAFDFDDDDYMYSNNRNSGFVQGDWATQVNGKFVKLDFDDDGDFEVKNSGDFTKEKGRYTVSQNTIVFKQWTKSYTFTYNRQGCNLTLTPVTKSDAALFGTNSTNQLTFQMYDD